MTDFTRVLPIEVTRYIFSYLEQNDCLQCVTVSRQWFNTIPAIALRQHLEISRTSWNLCSLAMSCLAAHAQSVTIDRQKAQSVLKQLKTYNCRIRKLGNKEICLAF
ncbi:hypothetical protein BDB00DRAFT_791729 [Zychaea mexicana]|uniref:uncharacterized protein n=1 Tax=Zychaea mexicana TaxID=64656 RepID=UPI0022FDFCDE|nr:uncharacterized protein BDB00DRAFT_791729 [Zychaea mexicana]KAI9488664.1 hypothetical protein BDB00DRAFT_791729 [Zychaea mexicana]